VNIIMTGLSSSSWTIKAQAGATARSVADKLGSQLGPPHLTTLLTSLMTALPGRTWTGKVMLIVFDVHDTDVPLEAQTSVSFRDRCVVNWVT